jgi:anti-sigma-K factor RskA
MSARDHERFRDDVGAYLLGALDEGEGQAFETHLKTCHICRDDVERLRLAVDALPRSVEQFDPPPTLKRSLMDIVEAEARERQGRPARPASVPLRQRLGAFIPARPRTALAAAMAALALAVAAGFGLGQLASDNGEQQSRTLAAKVDQQRVPGGQADLRVEGGGKNGGILRVSRFRQLPPGRTYQAWVDRGGQISPQPIFEVSRDGRGAVALPTDLSDVDKVYVSREPRGGSQAPSEVPIVQVELQ